MHRRRVLRGLGALAVAPGAGCMAELRASTEGRDGTDPTDSGPDDPCDGYAYRSDGTDEAPIPWDVRVTNISLSIYPVRVAIDDADGERVAGCTLDSTEHRKLEFDLSTDRRYHYRFDAPDLGTESRQFRGLRDNEEFLVTVERGDGFTVRRVHIDTVETSE